MRTPRRMSSFWQRFSGLKFQRSLDLDSSPVDQIGEDISYTGRLRVRNFEEMASPTFEEQSLPFPSSMMTNIALE